MGLKVNKTDSQKPADRVDFGRFARPIASGKYECIVDDADDEHFHRKCATLSGIKVTLRTVNAPAEKCPEGQVKLDWLVYPRDAAVDDKGKLLSDGSTLYEFCEAFDPRGNTDAGVELEGKAYVGRRCFAYINWVQAYNEGKGKAFVNKVIPIPGNQAPPASAGEAQVSQEAAPAAQTVAEAAGLDDSQIPF